MLKKMAIITLLLLAACTPAANQPGTSNVSPGTPTHAAIDAAVAAAKTACTAELTKAHGAEMADKICTCAADNLETELKKDPSAALDEKKMNALTPGITATCVKELLGSPSPTPAQ